jgi:hypothetical protein
LGEWLGVTDDEWAIIRPLLPPKRERWARRLAVATPAGDKHGKENSVFRRVRRWVEIGVFDALVETLSEFIERERSADVVDTTFTRVHHCAAGLSKGTQDQEAVGRSCGGFTTKIHARCDGIRLSARLHAHGRPSAPHQRVHDAPLHDRQQDGCAARGQSLRCRRGPRGP